MNIKRAKQEIKHAIEAYLLKDEEGNYEIPSQRQRPIFLIGAPGIGKRRSWSRFLKSVKLVLSHIQLRTIRDRALSGFRLSQRTYMMEMNIQ